MTEVVDLECSVKVALAKVKSCLVKYGLSIAPTHKDSDSRAVAFWADPEAAEAQWNYVRETSKLYRARHSDRVQQTNIDISIVEQQEIISGVYAKLKVFLAKYGLSVVLSHRDPAAAVFYQDAEAVKTNKAYARECYRLYALRHPERVQEVRYRAQTKYYEVHTHEEIVGKRRVYREANLLKVLEKERAYCRAHPEVNRAWYSANPLKNSEYGSRRRAALSCAEGSFTASEFKALCETNGNQCSYCGREESEVGKLIPDHMIPLSRGGSNSIDNITPACGSCNDSKRDKTVEEYLLWLEQQSASLAGGI